MEVEEDESASSDIVVRDKNGDVELDEPPVLVVDDPDEIALDMRQENESACFAILSLPTNPPPRLCLFYFVYFIAGMVLLAATEFGLVRTDEADLHGIVLQESGRGLLMLSNTIRSTRIVFRLNQRVSMPQRARTTPCVHLLTSKNIIRIAGGCQGKSQGQGRGLGRGQLDV